MLAVLSLDCDKCLSMMWEVSAEQSTCTTQVGTHVVQQLIADD